MRDKIAAVISFAVVFPLLPATPTMGRSKSARQAVARLFLSAIQKQSKNDLTGAIADYLAALEVDDTDPAIHWYLGTAYQAAGKVDEAKLEFEKEEEMKKVKKELDS